MLVRFSSWPGTAVGRTASLPLAFVPPGHPRLPFLPGASSMVGGTAQAPLPHLADRRSTVARSAQPRTIDTGNRTLFASMVAGHLLKHYKTVGCIRRCVARNGRLQRPAGMRGEGRIFGHLGRSPLAPGKD